MDENKDSKYHIWNSFFENIISDIQRFYIRHHVPVDITRVAFLFSRFSRRKSQIEQKLEKRLLILQYSFAQKTSLIFEPQPHSFWNSHNTAKALSGFMNFPANIFLFGVRKSICTAPFLDAQKLHFWSLLKANVCIFLYISLTKFWFHRVSNVLSDEGGLGKMWIIFSRWLAVWVS